MGYFRRFIELHKGLKVLGSCINGVTAMAMILQKLEEVAMDYSLEFREEYESTQDDWVLFILEQSSQRPPAAPTLPLTHGGLEEPDPSNMWPKSERPNHGPTCSQARAKQASSRCSMNSINNMWVFPLRVSPCVLVACYCLPLFV